MQEKRNKSLRLSKEGRGGEESDKGAVGGGGVGCVECGRERGQRNQKRKDFAGRPCEYAYRPPTCPLWLASAWAVLPHATYPSFHLL